MSKKIKKQSKKSAASTEIEFPIIKLQWKDHFSGNHSWAMAEDHRTDPMVNVTVGIVVNEDDETITLAQNMAENMLSADTTTVLKNCIVKRSRLGEVVYDKKANA